mgnify:CR=1 FL=1
MVPGPAPLLHDAHEAYIGDMVRPLKREFKEFKDIEAKVMRAVEDRFNLRYLPTDVLKWADDVVLRNEHRDLIDDGREWQVDKIGGPDIHIVPITPLEAEVAFLRYYGLYSGDV